MARAVMHYDMPEMVEVVENSRFNAMICDKSIYTISASQVQRHDILKYMMKNGSFNGDFVDYCWQFIENCI